MKKFVIRFFLLVIILFFGVLLGMQVANNGLRQMKGYDDHTLEKAFNLKNIQSGDVHAAILGQEITTHDIEKKQKKLEEMKAFHFFSNLGKQLSELFSAGFKQVILVIVKGFDKMIALIE